MDLRIGQGFVRRVVDGLATGMHEEGESHFELSSAFAGGEVLRKAAAHSEARGYLCHEFGDTTFISGAPSARPAAASPRHR